MRRIAIVGPESSGKTTLCEALAQHYAAPFVEECARDYLAGKNGKYEEDDLQVIACVQHDIGILRLSEGWKRHEAVYDFMLPGHEHFEQGARMAPKVRIPEMPLMLYDTDMITIKIWSQEKFGKVHPEIEELVKETKYDHWLLCAPDMPWEPDPLRENPHDRDRLFKVYEEMLRSLGRPFTIMKGDHEQRMRDAIEIIDVLIESDPVKEREV